MTTIMFHVHYTLACVEKALLENRHEDLFLEVDGRPATRKEILRIFEECTFKGYSNLPPCDNVDETGKCLGHKEKKKLGLKTEGLG